MAWTAENEGAKISFWTQTGPRLFEGRSYRMPLTIAAMTPPRSRHHPHMGSRQDRQGARHRPAQGRLLGSIARNDQSSSAAYTALVPNGFGDFWREGVGSPFGMP